MKTAAERLAPYLQEPLVIPGDPESGIKPTQLAPQPIFQPQVTWPKGLAEEMAEQAGLPHSDFALLHCQGIVHLIKTELGIDLDDPELTPERQQEKNTELEMLRKATAPRMSEIKKPKSACGVPVGRAIIRDLHTDEPTLPCAMVNHECKAR